MKKTLRSTLRLLTLGGTLFGLTIARAALAENTYAPCCSPVLGVSNNKTQHPEVVLIFWENGNEWETGVDSTGAALPFKRGQWIGAAQSMFNSAYFATVSQYQGSGVIFRPVLAPYAPTWSGTAPHSMHNTNDFTTQDVIDIAQSMILAGRVPAPMANDNTIYVVITPKGADTSAQCAGGDGCNFPSNNGDYTTAPFYAAFVHSWGSSETGTLGHEIVEAITGYEGIGVNNNCLYDGVHRATQIGDVCECNVAGAAVNGVWENGYYSAIGNECVVPTSYGPLLEMSGLGAGWTEPDARPLMQVYSGAGYGTNVIGRDTTGAPMIWEQAAGWSELPKLFGFATVEGSALAAGMDMLLSLPLDTSEGVNVYSLNEKAWGAFPALPNGPITSILVTSAGNGDAVVTDVLGQPWAWDWGASPQQWVQIGYPGDGFTAADADVLALSPDHSRIWKYPGSQFGTTSQSWTQVVSGAFWPPGWIAQIVANPNASQWGWTLSGSGGMGSTTLPWQGFAAEYATTDAFDAPILYRQATTSSPSPGAAWVVDNSGGYHDLYLPVGRVIGSLALYATLCGESSPAAGCVNYH